MILGRVILRHVGTGCGPRRRESLPKARPGRVPGGRKTTILKKGDTTMGEHPALVELTGFHGWVGPAAIVAGVLLLVVALFRRTRATLAKKRRMTRPSAGEWW
jgi:hypothetical protein